MWFYIDYKHEYRWQAGETSVNSDYDYSPKPDKCSKNGDLPTSANR